MSWLDDQRALSAAITQRGQQQGPPMPTEEELRRALVQGLITRNQYEKMTGKPVQGPPNPIGLPPADAVPTYFRETGASYAPAPYPTEPQGPYRR